MATTKKHARETEIDTETDLDEDDEGTEVEETEDVEQPKPRPRAALRDDVPPSIFGSVPQRATAWGIKRRTPIGQWETLSHVTPDGMAEIKEWPLAELSEARVREWWGGGTFRVMWWGTTDMGGRRMLAQGREFMLRAPVQEAAPAPVAPPPGLPDGFAQAIQLMNIIDQRATTQVTGMAQLAALMGRGSGGGLDAQTLTLLFDRQAVAMREAMAPVVERLSAVERRISDDDDDDDDEGAIDALASAAQTAGIGFKKGMSVGDMVKALVLQNPKEAAEVLKGIPQIVTAVAGMVTATQQQAQASRPRAEIRSIEAAPVPASAPPPAPEAPPGPGLNAVAAERAAAAAPTEK